MKKTAAVAVSIGVILVIVGLVMVGIFGGEALKNISWRDLFNGTNHDLNSANIHRDYDETAKGVRKIDINVDRYAVYVLPTDAEFISVHYVGPLDKGIEINAAFDVESSTFTVTEKDDLHSEFFVGLFKKDHFLVVYVPQTDKFTQSTLNIEAEVAGIKLQDVTFGAVECFAKTGGINVLNSTVGSLDAKTDTGSVNVKQLNCYALTVRTGTGSVTVKETTAVHRVYVDVDTGSVNCNVTAEVLEINTDTGSINFESNASDIKLNADTGSVRGTVLGNKSDYNVRVKQDTGSSNIQDQSPFPLVTKRLTVEVDTGSIKIDFSNN